jgi:3D (Asp-Asp-Asp) domain-containing protein
MRSRRRRGRKPHWYADLCSILSALKPQLHEARAWRRALILTIAIICVVSAAGALTIFAGEWTHSENRAETSFVSEASEIPPEFTGAPVTSGTKTVILKCDGEEKPVTTSQVTVFGVLEEAGIVLGENDEVFPNGNSGLLEQMEIIVIRVTEETQELMVEIPFETVVTPTPTLYKGEEKVVQEGRPGQRQITMVQTLRNGTLSEHRVIDSSLVSEPRDHIIWIGTKDRPATTRATTKSTTKATTKATTKSTTTVTTKTTTKATTTAPAEPTPPDLDTITTAGGQTYTFKKKINGESVAYYSSLPNPKTATGNPAIPGKTIAVDPSVIPLGSLVYITSVDGKSWTYGPAYAHDVGGGIKGNIVDLFKASYAEAVSHGRRNCIIYVLNP